MPSPSRQPLHLLLAAAALGARRSLSTLAYQQALTVETPLLYSFPISRLAQYSDGSCSYVLIRLMVAYGQEVPVLLKMESLQPSGSFKDRGMSLLCRELQKAGAKRVISSSGGNAGLSAATCGRVLGLPVQVIVPTTTKPLMLDKIRAQGAQVTVHGENWNAADELARKMVGEDEASAYISPYDHPLLWKGHSTLVDELVRSGVKPGAIVVSVGGGGLLCGIYEGLQRHGWGDVTVVTAETKGAASFYEAHRAGKLVRLSKIDTVATSLGALEVTQQALEGSKKQPTIAQVVSDQEAVSACRSFLQDHRMLIEPACGAALALVYTEKHRAKLVGKGPIVVVVCGGSGINTQLLDEMTDKLALNC